MITMQTNESKILELLGKALLCYKLANWLLSDLKKLLYSLSYAHWILSCSALFIIYSPKIHVMIWYQCRTNELRILELLGKVLLWLRLGKRIFSVLQNLLYSLSYGHWKISCSTLSLILLTKNHVVLWYQCKPVIPKYWNCLGKCYYVLN